MASSTKNAVFLDELQPIKSRLFLTDLSSITVPPIPCSFPANNHHRDCAKLKEMSDAWILSCFSSRLKDVGCTFTDHKKLVDSRIHLLVCLAYANGMSERMAAVVKFMVWFFMLDNLMDNPEAVIGADANAMEELFAAILAVLHGYPLYDKRSTPNVINVMVDATREMWSELSCDMPPRQQERFIQTMVEYMDANRLQLPYRTKRCLPDVQTYIRLRMDDVGWQPCAVLLEYALGVEFHPDTVAHPLIRRLKECATFHMGFENDLLSFAKEYKEGDFLNIVPVLYYNELQQRSSSSSRAAPPNLEGAVAEASRMIKAMDEESTRLMQEIRECEALMQEPRMEAFLKGVGNWMGGNLRWHLMSPRYGIFHCITDDQCPPSGGCTITLTLLRRQERPVLQ